MKAKITIDPRLISLLGRKLYTYDPVVIAVREMLQNSVDACKKANVKPEISIKLEYNRSTMTCGVTVTDNGCGMTEQVLDQYFLRYGSSTKAGSAEETGRFGVGVGIVLCGNYWHVRTLDNELDRDTALAEQEMSKLKDTLAGTEIYVEYKNVSQWNFESQARLMVAFSDVDVRYTYSVDGSIRTLNEHLGLKESKVLMTEEEKWKGYGTKSFKVSNDLFSGIIAVRLNGLVQHFRHIYGNEMRGNLLVDLDSHLEPDDPAFPMVMSREKLTGEVDLEVQQWVEKQAKNGASSDRQIKRSLESDNITFVRGKLLRGKRNPRGFVEERLEELMDWDDERLTAIKEFIRQASRSPNLEETSDLHQYIDNFGSTTLMRLMNYEYTEDDFERDASFADVWGAILELVALEGYKFAIGLTTEDNIYSECIEIEDVVFFTINPRAFPEQETVEDQVESLWIKACHEIAHIQDGGHGEKFQATVEYIQMATIGAKRKNMSRLARILGKNK